MPATDTSEKGLEALIADSLVREAGYAAGVTTGYDREHAVDLAKLLAFLRDTQPKVVETLSLDEEGPKRAQFLARLQGEIAKRGVIDVLRTGVKDGPAHVDLFYGSPSPGNTKAEELFAKNIFSVTRQLRYSCDETQLALDLGLFINGLPVATFELKNNLTKQTVADAVRAVSARPRPARAALSSSAAAWFTSPSMTTRCASAPPQGQGLLVPALQQGLQRRRRQPAEPRRHQDRLPLEGASCPGRASPTSSRTTLKSSRRRTRRPARRSASRFSPAITS
jgi:type I site-specific restriction-modification system R (restriction) subunit